MIRFLIRFTLFLTSMWLYSQEQFVKTYGDTWNQTISPFDEYKNFDKLLIEEDGSYILSGLAHFISHNSSGYEQFADVTKIDSNGNVIWSYNHKAGWFGNHISIAKVVKNSNKEYVVIGEYKKHNNSLGDADSHYFIFKLDSNGNYIVNSERKIGGSYFGSLINIEIWDILVTTKMEQIGNYPGYFPIDEYILTGRSVVDGTFWGWVLKLDKNFEPINGRIFREQGDQKPCITKIIRDFEDGFVVIYEELEVPFNANRLLHLNEDLSLRKAVSIPSDIRLNSIIRTNDENFVLCGKYLEGVSGTNAVLLKVDAYLDHVLWMKIHPHANSSGTIVSIATDVCETSDNGYILIGFHKLNGKIYTFLIKTNNEGESIFGKKFRDPNQDYTPRGIAQSLDGGFSVLASNNTKNHVLIKTNAQGEVPCNVSDFTLNDHSYPISIGIKDFENYDTDVITTNIQSNHLLRMIPVSGCSLTESCNAAIPQITGNFTLCNGQSTFLNSSVEFASNSGGINYITSHQWDIVGPYGTIQTGAVQSGSPTTFLVDPGESVFQGGQYYSIRLTVTTPCGESYSTTHPITFDTTPNINITTGETIRICQDGHNIYEYPIEFESDVFPVYVYRNNETTPVSVIHSSPYIIPEIPLASTTSTIKYTFKTEANNCGHYGSDIIRFDTFNVNAGFNFTFVTSNPSTGKLTVSAENIHFNHQWKLYKCTQPDGSDGGTLYLTYNTVNPIFNNLPLTYSNGQPIYYKIEHLVYVGTPTNIVCQSTKTRMVYGSGRLAVEDPSVVTNPDNNLSIVLYPNPTSSKTTINLQTITSGTYSIYAFDGRLVDQKSFSNQNKLEFDLSEQSQGVYLLNIQTNDNQQITKRIIKQ